LRAVAADFFLVGVWKSLPVTIFSTNQGVSTIKRKAFDWKHSRISMLKVEAVPQSNTQIQIGLSIALYMRSFLLVESFDLHPSNE
jgi:hypothetical protein